MKAWRLHNMRLAARDDLSPQEKKDRRIRKSQVKYRFTDWKKAPSPLLVALLERVGLTVI